MINKLHHWPSSLDNIGWFKTYFCR